ncbi:MAG: hypothetical protein HRT35_02955 [Algicola sp.]|nr:hypothetical protein [Algicola sp.]
MDKLTLLQSPSQTPLMSSTNKAGDDKLQCNQTTENTQVPCDVGGLKLEFIDSSGKTYSAVAFNTLSNRSPEPPPPNVGFHITEQYKKAFEYDVILEAIAPAFRADDTDLKKATFRAAIENPIGTCPTNEHVLVAMQNTKTENRDGLQGRQTWLNSSIASMDIYGKALPIDNQTGKFNLTDVLYIFQDTQAPKHVKDIYVTATSCGVRDDGQPPNKIIRGLIRVYREDKYVLEITVPSLMGKKSAYKEERNTKGEKTLTQAKWAGGNTTTEKWKNGDLKEYGESDRDHFVTSTSTLDDSTDVQNSQTDTKKLKKFAKLTRNGHELGVLNTINSIIKVREMIVNGVKFIDELKNSVPQVGFGWSFELDVLAGTITGEWGIQSGADFDSAEYKWIEPYGKINLDLALLKLKFEASFGVECKSADILNWFGRTAFEIIIKATVIITLDCTVKKTIQLVGNDQNEDVLWTNSFASKGEINAQFKVNVFGYGMDSKSGVIISITADFVVEKPFRVKATVERNEAYLYAYFAIGKSTSERWKKVLCKKSTIMKDKYVID